MDLSGCVHQTALRNQNGRDVICRHTNLMKYVMESIVCAVTPRQMGQFSNCVNVKLALFW